MQPFFAAAPASFAFHNAGLNTVCYYIKSLIEKRQKTAAFCPNFGLDVESVMGYMVQFVFWECSGAFFISRFISRIILQFTAICRMEGNPKHLHDSCRRNIMKFPSIAALQRAL